MVTSPTGASTNTCLRMTGKPWWAGTDFDLQIGRNVNLEPCVLIVNGEHTLRSPLFVSSGAQHISGYEWRWNRFRRYILSPSGTPSRDVCWCWPQSFAWHTCLRNSRCVLVLCIVCIHLATA